MPELPEVETVARDLRPRIVGRDDHRRARARGRGPCGRRTPEAFAEASPGRRVEAVGRRGKQLVVDLSGDAALTIHLKMTGQLFVVPAETPGDPYVRLVLELADGRELRFRDIRKFGRIGLYGRDPVTGELVTEVGGAAVFAAIGPGAARSARSRSATSGAGCGARKGRLKPLLLDQSFLAGVGNIYADEALWAARLHPLRTARHAAPAGRAAPVRRESGGSSPRRSSGAARSIDDYTAPDGDGSMQEHLAGLPADRRAVPALRPADQADRRRRPVDALLLVVPAAAGRATARARRRSCGR